MALLAQRCWSNTASFVSYGIYRLAEYGAGSSPGVSAAVQMNMVKMTSEKLNPRSDAYRDRLDYFFPGPRICLIMKRELEYRTPK